MAYVPICRLCDGSGWLILMKSWFRSDGYRKERCGVCGGSGRSSYKPPHDYAREQAELRRASSAPTKGE